MRLRELIKLVFEDYNEDGSFTDERGNRHETITSLWLKQTGGKVQLPSKKEQRAMDLGIARRREAEQRYHNPYKTRKKTFCVAAKAVKVLCRRDSLRFAAKPHSSRVISTR